MLEGEITYNELDTALKNMKNSKSPGIMVSQQSFLSLNIS